MPGTSLSVPQIRIPLALADFKYSAYGTLFSTTHTEYTNIYIWKVNCNYTGRYWFSWGCIWGCDYINNAQFNILLDGEPFIYKTGMDNVRDWYTGIGIGPTGDNRTAAGQGFLLLENGEHEFSAVVRSGSKGVAITVYSIDFSLGYVILE